MSKLVIKMVYNPNRFQQSQIPCPTFISNQKPKITKTRNLEKTNQALEIDSDINFWQDDQDDFNLVTLLVGIIPFAVGLQLFISSLFLPEISAYREIYILLTLLGLIILKPEMGKKNNAKTGLGN